jgi:hypothetical protein
MKLDPGMHIGMHLVSFGKSGVTLRDRGELQLRSLLSESSRHTTHRSPEVHE